MLDQPLTGNRSALACALPTEPASHDADESANETATRRFYQWTATHISNRQQVTLRHEWSFQQGHPSRGAQRENTNVTGDYSDTLLEQPKCLDGLQIAIECHRVLGAQ